MHIVHATVSPSLSLRLVRRLRTSLSDSSSRPRIVHITLSPDFVVQVLNLVLIQADVSDIFPKGIDIASGVKSGKICRCLGSLLTWLLRGSGHVGFVWIESTAAEDRIIVVFAGLFLLNIFDSGTESVRCPESSR